MLLINFYSILFIYWRQKFFTVEQTFFASTEANIYFKRLSGFVLSGTRAIIKINEQTLGSLYNNDFLKIEVQGNQMLTVAGDPLAGVFGRTTLI